MCTLDRLLNKHAIIEQIVSALAAELEGFARSARAAHAEATDEQSKAENKYDTRGLEASYLARGQSLQAAETVEAMEQYQSLTVRKFGPSEAIDLGAVVELEADGERTIYFIGPRAGGTEILQDGRSVLVITPQSPLGRQLVGRKLGDRLELRIGATNQTFRVAAVW